MKIQFNEQGKMVGREYVEGTLHTIEIDEFHSDGRYTYGYLGGKVVFVAAAETFISTLYDQDQIETYLTVTDYTEKRAKIYSDVDYKIVP